MGHSKSSVKRKVHSTKCLHKKQNEEILYQQLNSTSRSSRIKRSNHTKEEKIAKKKKKKIAKARAKIKKIEIKSTKLH